MPFFPFLSLSYEFAPGVVVHEDKKKVYKMLALANGKLVTLLDRKILHGIRNASAERNMFELLVFDNRPMTEVVRMTARALFRCLKFVPDYFVVIGEDAPLACGYTMETFCNILRNGDVTMERIMHEAEGAHGGHNVLGKAYWQQITRLAQKGFLDAPDNPNDQNISNIPNVIDNKEAPQAMTCSNIIHQYKHQRNEARRRPVHTKRRVEAHMNVNQCPNHEPSNVADHGC